MDKADSVGHRALQRRDECRETMVLRTTCFFCTAAHGLAAADCGLPTGESGAVAMVPHRKPKRGVKGIVTVESRETAGGASWLWAALAELGEGQ